jgi:hypothetical protein
MKKILTNELKKVGNLLIDKNNIKVDLNKYNNKNIKKYQKKYQMNLKK